MTETPQVDRLAPTISELWQGLCSKAGERTILEQNLCIENLLPGPVIRSLSHEEMAEYRRPFAQPGEGRRPRLRWPSLPPFDLARF